MAKWYCDIHNITSDYHHPGWSSCPYCMIADKQKIIDTLTAQLGASQALLAERDAEIVRLKESEEALTDCLNGSSKAMYTAEMYDKLRTENASLREEVERLKERLEANAAKIDDDDVVIEWSDYIKLKEEVRKQTAAEILDSLTQEEIRRITSVGDPRVTTISSKLLAMMAELRQRYGLEG